MSGILFPDVKSHSTEGELPICNTNPVLWEGAKSECSFLVYLFTGECDSLTVRVHVQCVGLHACIVSAVQEQC